MMHLWEQRDCEVSYNLLALERWLSCSVWLPPSHLGYLHRDSVSGVCSDGHQASEPSSTSQMQHGADEALLHLPGKEKHLHPRATPALCVKSRVPLSSMASCAEQNSNWLCTRDAKGLWGAILKFSVLSCLAAILL